MFGHDLMNLLSRWVDSQSETVRPAGRPVAPGSRSVTDPGATPVAGRAGTEGASRTAPPSRLPSLPRQRHPERSAEHLGVEGRPPDAVVLNGSAPVGPTAVYLLVHNPPETPAAGYGRGWTLVASHASTPCWSVSLAAHGADTHAGPRVAKAVAMRVLADHGVWVEGWCDGDSAEPAMFRARLYAEDSTPTDGPRRPRIRTRALRTR